MSDLPFNKLVDNRPWGYFTQYAYNQVCTVKIIQVNPQEQLSLQEHALRDEYWIALDAGLVVTIGEDVRVLLPGDEVFIPRKTLHTVKNASVIEKARFVELAFGVFDEKDIIRKKDIYGRT